MSNCGIIYKLRCNETGKFYIGSTKHLAKRMERHRSSQNDCRSKIIIQQSNYTEIVMGLHLYNKDSELFKIEGGYLRDEFFHPLCVNRKLEGRTKREYYQDMKSEKKMLNKKTYYELNKKKKKEETEEEKQKKYKEKKEKQIAARDKTPITCCCGSTVASYRLNKHKKTQKHIDYETKMSQLCF